MINNVNNVQKSAKKESMNAETKYSKELLELAARLDGDIMLAIKQIFDEESDVYQKDVGIYHRDKSFFDEGLEDECVTVGIDSNLLDVLKFLSKYTFGYVWSLNYNPKDDEYLIFGFYDKY